jgi:anti-sigma regulatory factor (Ser/Thr protein kinase)
VSVLELPPTTESVPTARRFVRDLMGQSETAADVDTATLLVTEIVTNAVLHALTPMTVHVAVAAEVVRIEVRDGSLLPPRVHAFSASAATGRGLRLLQSLATRWGVRPEPPDGKVVWFEVGPASETAWDLSVEDWAGEDVPDDV